jgi:NAD(P)H-dependent flavin oxidoreductase YrpB (nitropropane dioxygenase family)
VRIHGEAPLQPLPWSRETLTAPFLIAAGGIRTGENMRWAMEIGFDGVVMGTRFEVCDETCLPEDLVESEIGKAVRSME